MNRIVCDRRSMIRNKKGCVAWKALLALARLGDEGTPDACSGPVGSRHAHAVNC
jgi:hypothetical protein